MAELRPSKIKSEITEEIFRSFTSHKANHPCPPSRFVTGRKHMGEPESFSIILRWIYNLLEIRPVHEPSVDEAIVAQLEMLKFTPRFA